MPPSPSLLLVRGREDVPEKTNKVVIYIVIIFPVVGALVAIALCWARGCAWLRRRERREATRRRLREGEVAVQELRDARIHRGRGSADDEEEIARVLAEGEVAPAYHEPGVTVVVEGGGAEAPRYEQVVEEARRELPQVVPPAYVK